MATMKLSMLLLNVSNILLKMMAAALSDPSALLKHELCYVMGQTKNHYAVPILSEVLAKENEDSMVRHEVTMSTDWMTC